MEIRMSNDEILDIGDILAVPEAERLEVDDPEPNDDADADLSDVPDGDVVDLSVDVEA